MVSRAELGKMVEHELAVSQVQALKNGLHNEIMRGETFKPSHIADQINAHGETIDISGVRDSIKSGDVKRQIQHIVFEIEKFLCSAAQDNISRSEDELADDEGCIDWLRNIGTVLVRLHEYEEQGRGENLPELYRTLAEGCEILQKFIEYKARTTSDDARFDTSTLQYLQQMINREKIQLANWNSLIQSSMKENTRNPRFLMEGLSAYVSKFSTLVRLYSRLSLGGDSAERDVMDRAIMFDADLQPSGFFRYLGSHEHTQANERHGDLQTVTPAGRTLQMSGGASIGMKEIGHTTNSVPSLSESRGRRSFRGAFNAFSRLPHELLARFTPRSYHSLVVSGDLLPQFVDVFYDDDVIRELFDRTIKEMVENADEKGNVSIVDSEGRRDPVRINVDKSFNEIAASIMGIDDASESVRFN